MKENTENYRKGLSKQESFLLSELARENKSIFTVKQARKIFKEEPYLILHSLKKKKWILTLKSGLYAIVPLDIGVKGSESYIVHDFVIASYLVKPYYIGFWSALNYHGLSDQIPRTVFVSTTKAKKPLNILNTEFNFIQLHKNKFIGIEEIEMEEYKIKISNINKTVVDCLDHSEHCGGIDEISRSIFFNHEELNFKKIRNYGIKMKNITIFKRLGYILEKIELLDKYEEILRGIKLTKGYPMLDKIAHKKGKYNEKWKLIINVNIEPKRWMY